MTWLGLFLVGVGATDLLRSVSGGRGRLPEDAVGAVGAAVAVALAVLAGLPGLVDVAALVVLAGLTVAWGVAVRRSERSDLARPERAAGLPLAVLGGGVLLGVVLAPLASPATGAWARWVAALPWGQAAQVDPDRALLLLGVVLVQLTTGNHVVRLVLAATGTTPPQVPGADHPSLRLKGGRLLGPMERLVILGLGLAGQLTAASIVIAAKGLLRWPELSSNREQQAIHRLTEYFLVGSFVSWSIALLGLLLTR